MEATQPRDPAVQRRKYPRFASTVPFVGTAEGKLISGFTLNLSSSGLLLALKQPVRLGNDIEGVCRLSDGTKWVFAARARWVTESRDQLEGHPFIVGAQLMEVPQAPFFEYLYVLAQAEMALNLF
jgi:hypothetical protein